MGLEGTLDGVKVELLRLQEENRLAGRELAGVSREKALAENQQQIYCELVQILCSTILTRDSGMNSLPSNARQGAMIFTPDGMYMDDGSESPSEQTLPFTHDNDSGFVGSQTHLDAEVQVRFRTNSSLTSIE